eukprot:713534-Prymnesium_polylepis.1
MMRQDTLAMAEQCTRMSDKVYDTAIKKSVKFAKQRVIGLRDEVKEILVAKKETVVHKVAFEYDMSSAGVLSHVKGTFWPLVAVRFELYVSSQGLELQSFAYASRSTGVRIPAWTGVPRGTHGASRMVRAPSCQRRTGAVCYNRFSTFLGLCLDIETAVHDSSLMILAFAEPGWAKQQHNPRAGAGAQARSWQ